MGYIFFRIICLSYVFIPLNFIRLFTLFPWWFYFEYFLWLVATLVIVNPKYLKESYMLFQQIWRGKKLVHQTFKVSNELNDHTLLHIIESRDNSCRKKNHIRYFIQTHNCSTHIIFFITHNFSAPGLARNISGHYNAAGYCKRNASRPNVAYILVRYFLHTYLLTCMQFPN